jgi:hypothetical protein
MHGRPQEIHQGGPYFYVHPDTQCASRMYKCALRSTKQKLNNKPTTRKYEYY